MLTFSPIVFVSGSPLEAAFLIYLLFVNLAGFTLMGLDKYKAKKHLWRIPEKTLFLAALVGGSAGSIAGMYFFHHKTKHWYFVIGMPLILIAQLLLVTYLNFAA